jgi:hypothetical protein
VSVLFADYIVLYCAGSNTLSPHHRFYESPSLCRSINASKTKGRYRLKIRTPEEHTREKDRISSPTGSQTWSARPSDRSSMQMKTIKP